MDRPVSVAIALTALLVLSGCSGLPGSGTQTPGTPLVESGPGDYPHEILVHNSLEDDVSVTITVERNGTEIYRNQTTVSAGTDPVVGGFTRAALPENTSDVTVSATDGADQTATVEVSISDCLGDVEFFYEDDGSLEGTYSIC